MRNLDCRVDSAPGSNSKTMQLYTVQSAPAINVRVLGARIDDSVFVQLMQYTGLTRMPWPICLCTRSKSEACVKHVNVL
jgi:hypothetical protein